VGGIQFKELVWHGRATDGIRVQELSASLGRVARGVPRSQPVAPLGAALSGAFPGRSDRLPGVTLFVDYETFPAAVRRHCAGAQATVYVQLRGSVPVISFFEPSCSVHVVCIADDRASEDVEAEMRAHGFEVLHGLWVSEASIEQMLEAARATYVAAVAYNAKGGPGLWMDAYPFHPTEGTVLRTLFVEFVSEGLLRQDDFELFLREAEPIVRILTPEDAERFVRAHIVSSPAPRAGRGSEE